MLMELTPTFVQQDRTELVKAWPQVSVLLSFENAGKHLAESIESVLAQSYHDWELLLCDDGSTDVSRDIARRYAQWYPAKIKYLHHPGQESRGSSVTRNLGFTHASGQYIAWLDSDEVWRQHKLEQQVALLNQHREAAMVYGPREHWYSWTGGQANAQQDCLQDIGVPGGTLLKPRQLLIHFLKDDRFLPSGSLMHKTVLEDIGGFDESIRDDCDDVVVHAKVNMHWPVLAASASWCRRRQHPAPSDVATDTGSRDRQRRLVSLNLLMRYMREEHVEDETLWRLIEGQMQINQQRWGRLVCAACQRVIAGMIDRIYAKLTRTGRVMPRLLPINLQRTHRRDAWCRQSRLPSD